MRLMVIGASGFLGAHVRHRASAAGAEVVTAGRSELADSPRHRLIDLAEENPARVAAMIAEVAPDAVVNCAGATTGPPGALAAANITGAYTLTKAMLLTRRPPRLVHLGSAAEYGRAEPGVPVTEQVTPRPGAIYGATKLAGTRLVELAAAAGLDAVVLRVFNPVGPGAQQASLPGRLTAELRQASRHDTGVRLGSLDAVPRLRRRAGRRRRRVRRRNRGHAPARCAQHRQRAGSARPHDGQAAPRDQRMHEHGARGYAGAGALGRHPLATGRHQLRRS